MLAIFGLNFEIFIWFESVIERCLQIPVENVVPQPLDQRVKRIFLLVQTFDGFEQLWEVPNFEVLFDRAHGGHKLNNGYFIAVLVNLNKIDEPFHKALI